MMFRSPLKRIFFLRTQRAVAISSAVSPELGIITSLAWLFTNIVLSISVLLMMSKITSDLYFV